MSDTIVDLTLDDDDEQPQAQPRSQQAQINGRQGGRMGAWDGDEVECLEDSGDSQRPGQQQRQRSLGDDEELAVEEERGEGERGAEGQPVRAEGRFCITLRAHRERRLRCVSCISADPHGASPASHAVWNKSFPHLRYQCGEEPFKKGRHPSNKSHCSKVGDARPARCNTTLSVESNPRPTSPLLLWSCSLQCFCFICDCLASECEHWGDGEPQAAELGAVLGAAQTPSPGACTLPAVPLVRWPAARRVRPLLCAAGLSYTDHCNAHSDSNFYNGLKTSRGKKQAKEACPPMPPPPSPPVQPQPCALVPIPDPELENNLVLLVRGGLQAARCAGCCSEASVLPAAASPPRRVAPASTCLAPG